eukprot:4308737-Alexandrium_andersonii.AAC.1
MSAEWATCQKPRRPGGEATPPPQGRFGALLVPSPSRRRTIGRERSDGPCAMGGSAKRGACGSEL